MFARMSSSKIGCALAAELVTVSLAVAISSTGATAASSGKPNYEKAHRVHHVYPAYRGPRVAHAATLPYGPEYGFLTHIPPNAIRMPGYTYVPGVGILGESCDLPSSACPNEYRDIQ
jgi:hypothetical protein